MDSIPKLLPTWHNIALQDFIRQKGYSKFSSLNSPDYGGIGIDVNDNSMLQCRNSKYTRRQMSFAADSCALPFLPLQKIGNLKDSCLEHLKKEKSEFDKFCMKLTSVRDSVKKKKDWPGLEALKHRLNVCKHEKRNGEININVPKNILSLAENLPKSVFIPKVNVTYAGGALAVYNSSSNQNLLHPVSGYMNKLCITPLQDGIDKCFEPDISGQMTVDLRNEPILQIEPAINDFCCVRQKHSFHLVNIANMNNFTKTVNKSSLYHIAVRPYNPMEILSVYENGKMKLRNMETRKTLWSVSDDAYDDSYLVHPTWKCGFGSHPFSALCMNQKKVYNFDFREKKYTVRDIFSIENPSCYTTEELFAIKQWNKNPFQHLLSSSHHLIISDERYPKKPVMYWSHTLKDSPMYLECADFDNNVSLIVIGTQGTQELAAFLCSYVTDIHPVSLTPPLLLSSPTDCIDSLKLHCYNVEDNISSRLSCALTGACIIPNSKEIGFTVLQSTSLGDIFYQDFKQSSEAIERTYHVSTGCILTPPIKILPHLKDWISNSDADETLDNMDDFTHIHINIEKFLSPPKEISSNCMLCRLSSSSDEKELVLSETCPTCNLDSAESQHFSKAVANGSAIIGCTSEELGFLDCDMDYLSGFSDTYSKKILSVWLESGDLGDSQNMENQNMISSDVLDGSC